MRHAGWRSRGYLPHCDARELVQHIIFGLADAMPRSVPSRLTDPTQRGAWADKQFDGGHGARILVNPAYAQIVEDALLHDDGERYALTAWCVMPTHVHVVAEQFANHTLADIVQTWKSVSAHAINKRERRRGPLWRSEYFDRFMRSPDQFEWTVASVENNPVAAGLTANASDWRYSSAHWKRMP